MILELHDAHAGYGKHKTLNGVSISLQSKDVICLLGPNGAGKSTLFKCILGLMPLIQGKITCNGEDISKWSRSKKAKTIGYIPQSHIPTFQYKAISMVLMGRTAHIGRYATPSAKDIAICEAAMERLSISHLKDTLYTEMSGGERQLVLIARSLAQNPGFLIMDEPTNNLDFGNQVLVLRHVQALARDGIGIIMASHYPDHAFLYSSKVVLIKKGKIFGTGAPDEIVTEKKLNELYGIETCIAKAYIKNRPQPLKVCLPQEHQQFNLSA